MDERLQSPLRKGNGPSPLVRGHPVGPLSAAPPECSLALLVLPVWWVGTTSILPIWGSTMLQMLETEFGGRNCQRARGFFKYPRGPRGPSGKGASKKCWLDLTDKWQRKKYKSTWVRDFLKPKQLSRKPKTLQTQNCQPFLSFCQNFLKKCFCPPPPVWLMPGLL